MFWNIVREFLNIAVELTALFIGISLFINLIQGIIPYDKVNRYLTGKYTLLGALMALVLAFVTPFCSCSTILVVVNLLNKKVRFGVVMVFLFSSPVLDPMIITLMTAMLGVKVAVAYTIITSVLSVIIGFTLEKLGFEKSVKRVTMSGFNETIMKFSFSNAWKETWD